jgi:hypothetical protein
MSQSLASVFTINRNFQRAKRLDTDLAVEGLDGYQLNHTAWHILNSFSEDVHTSRQRAFTWTGPYGSGKSSLALVLAALLAAPQSRLQRAARGVLGEELAATFRKRMPVAGKGWLVVRIVGRRQSPLEVMWESLHAAWAARWGAESAAALIKQTAGISPLSRLTRAIEAAAKRATREGNGLLIVVDEMGKFLEFAALDDGDLYPFQEIAELMSRLDARCAFLGILHQSFDEYARRSSRAARAEWSKIQGRFSDTPFSIAIEEVITLIACALDGPQDRRPMPLAEQVSAAISGGRFGKLRSLPESLAACAPLHPVTALLLGPISRRRFGQNERSVFSFLSSREPRSFGEFLEQQPDDSTRLFTPADLWDYLQLNHEPTILASPDGGRWSEASEALVRVSRRKTTTGLHLSALKTIAILDLFGTQFGLSASDELVALSLSDHQALDAIAPCLGDLMTWSAIIRRRHAGGWGIFAGSDIDIEAEVDRARATVSDDLEQILANMPELPPIVAKRHYAETGTLRVFDRHVRAAGSAGSKSSLNVTGRFQLVVGTPDADGSDALTTDRLVAQSTTLTAYIGEDHPLLEAGATLAALERVQATLPQLEGDPAARRELGARLTRASGDLAELLGQAFESSDWHTPLISLPQTGRRGMSELASDVCDGAFADCPEIINELLNREKPSSSAVAARRRLCYAMVDEASEARLGIEGEPAELGLYLSLLALPGIHAPTESEDKWEFRQPADKSFGSMWAAGLKLLREASDPVSVDDLYRLWQRQPYGIRAGVLPVFALAMILANQRSIALYVEGNFTTGMDDLLIDRLLQGPHNISLRWVESNLLGLDTLLSIAQFVESEGLGRAGSTALEVTKPLVQFAMRLPGWVRRTRQLTYSTLGIRDVLLTASDPFKLLYDDLPKVCPVDPADGATGIDVQTLAAAVHELQTKQEELVGTFRKNLGRALLADFGSSEGRSEIAGRAAVVAEAPETMDLRTKRFAQILARAESDQAWMDAVCSLAAGKPIKDWADPDVGRTGLEINGLAEQFGQIEATIAAHSPDGARLADASRGLLDVLERQNLNSYEQRAALLYALKQLGETELEKAA